MKFFPYTPALPSARALGAAILAGFLASACAAAAGLAPTLPQPASAVVRWSELAVDRGQLDRFGALAHRHLQETRRAEPGVLAVYAASEKEHPERIRVLEVFTGADALRSHLHSPHVRAFQSASRALVTEQKLFDAAPVALGAKPGLPPPGAVVRIAELTIDPARLDAYTAAVTEEIAASIRVEPGVFAIYAVALKDQPNQLRFFEIYANEQAYLHHRDTPHFRKYVDVTASMITERRLIETVALPPAPSK